MTFRIQHSKARRVFVVRVGNAALVSGRVASSHQSVIAPKPEQQSSQ